MKEYKPPLLPEEQITALKWQLKQDIPGKDREIFQWTVKELENALSKLERDALTKEETGSSCDI